jgi:uncharacterized protein involved in exopolysaccharide biosynthesis
MTEAEKRLAEVRAAISQILENGQSVRKGDREVRRAELNSLRILEEQYSTQVARDAAAKRGRNRITYMSI